MWSIQDRIIASDSTVKNPFSSQHWTLFGIWIAILRISKTTFSEAET